MIWFVELERSWERQTHVNFLCSYQRCTEVNLVLLVYRNEVAVSIAVG